MSFGYKAITPIKLLNGVGAYNANKVSFKALRVYLACFELVAIREAAKRSSKLKPKKGEMVCYKKDELIRLTGGLTLRSITKSLRELENASVMEFRRDRITFTDIPLGESRDLLENALPKRKGSRKIPVPRKLIRFLGSLNKPSLFLTILGYMIRGLSIDRKTGEVNPKGTVKASWISDVFGISLRSAKSSRASMIEMGLISKDENSYQRKLNRDGAYFRLNLSLFESKKENKSRGDDNKTVDDFSSSKPKFAPPIAKKCTEFAPPMERLKTSKENKNHKTWKSKPNGVYKKTGSRKPNIRKIEFQDLKEFSRNEELYWQAVSLGLISTCEADVLNWIASSVRARDFENSGAIFMGIIRKKLYNHITQSQEDFARKALKRRREKFPEAYRIQDRKAA
jgi:hypothetical protein